MILQAKKNLYLVRLFKFAMIVHIACLIINLTLRPYFAAYPIINNIIEYSLFISVLCITLIITIKTMLFFAQNHHYLMQHYKAAGLVIESCIAIIIAGLIFLNQEITGKFVIFIADLSHQAHSNKIILLMILLGIYFCLELYHAHEINKKSMESRSSTQKTIIFHLITFILKVSIIAGTAIGFMHPIAQILQPDQFKQFDNLIFHFTTTEFFLYIHTIIMILLGLWLTIGMYYVYNFYKKGK